LFVAQSGGQVSRWDAVNGERLAIWKLPTDHTIRSLAYSAGELACVQASGEIYIVSESGVPLRHGGRPLDWRTPRSISWNSDHSRLAFVDADHGARIVDSHTLAEVWKTSRHDCLQAVFSPLGDRVAVSGFGGMELINATDFSPASPNVYSESGDIYQVAWSPDGKQVAEASEYGRVVIYDSTEMKLNHVLERHSGPVASVQWAPNGRRIATASEDATVRIWDAATFEQLAVMTCPAPLSKFTRVAWSPDGQRLAATTTSGRLIIWDASPVRGNSLKKRTIEWSEKTPQEISAPVKAPTLDELTAAIEAQPESVEARLQRGQWYRQRHLWVEALADLEAALDGVE